MVELMVALTVGLLVIGGLMTIFVQSSRTNREMTQLVQQMENGRFALQLLREDIWHAGFWGEYNPDPDVSLTGIPDPCKTYDTATPWDATYKDNFLALPVYGYSNAAAPGDTCGSVITNGKTNTDVLIVRHASICTADTGTNGNCEDETADKLYLQVSFCYKDTPPENTERKDTPFVLDKDSSQFILHGKDCNTPSPKRKVFSNIYYIDNDNILRRSALDLQGVIVKQQNAQALIEGIEYMKIEYGVDYGIDTNGDGTVDDFTKFDGIPDKFVANPATLAPTYFANKIHEAWGNVMAVKLYLLARTLEPSPGYDDAKVYQVGPTRLPASGDGFHDSYKRHVYSTYVRLINHAGRMDKP